MPHVSELHLHHSPQKLEELGRNFYRQKKYTEALEAFNASTKSAGAVTVNLLDSRAATHEKLGNLDAALKDGRNMIEMSKGEVQGYLRTAKVLQQLNKADLALKIYERGLRLVPAKQLNYELLHKLHSKLTRKLAKPEAKDILAILPVELIEMIFAHLPFKQLCKCLRVSKHWKTLLTAWPRFWAKIDVSGSKRPLRERMIKPYISYSRGIVSEATLNCADLQGSRVLDILFERCKLLAKVSITGGGFLGESLVRASVHAKNLKVLHTGSAVISQDTAMQIMSNCSNLEEVSFGSVLQDPFPTPWPPSQTLRSFSIKLMHPVGRSRPSNVTLREICPQSKVLEVLRLESGLIVDGLLGDFELVGLKELRIQGITISAPPQGLLFHLPNCLRKLDLRNTNCFKKGLLPSSAVQFPDLDTLVVAELQGIHLEVLRQFISLNGSSFVEFTASSSWDTTEELMKILLQARMKNVAILDLSGSEKLTDKEATIIADSLHDLASINLSGTQMTGVGVKKLVQALPKLRRLVIRDCAQISPDAVEWARQQKKLDVVYHCKSL